MNNHTKLVLLILTGIFFLVSCKNEGFKSALQSKLVSHVVHPEWSRNAVIYEVNLRQFTPEGTFMAFEAHLPRLREMGVDILWLMPVHPIGEENRKGTLGSYYSVQDYTGINPEFGTLQDFKELVNKAHTLGMFVIIDWVANHSSWDNPWITVYPEWYKKDSLGKMLSPFDWTDVVALDYNNTQLREAMLAALKYWIIETDIDGYRCDVAGMVPVDFWNDARETLDSLKPVFMLAEAEEPVHHEKAFDMSYSWELHHLMNCIAKGTKNANVLMKYFNKQETLYPRDAYRMNFITNHDENSWNGTEFERMGDGAETFAVLTFTLPGMPLLYTGQEAPLKKRLEFFEKDTIDWNEYQLTGFYKQLIEMKKENKALWNGEEGGVIQRISTNADTAIFAFRREKGENRVVVISNLTDIPIEVKLEAGNYEGRYKNWFTKEEIIIGRKQSFLLKPWEYRVYTLGD